jgi:hypothetical protein
MPETCRHSFSLFSIAMLGMRWQCIKCDLIAPACFKPRPQATTRYQRLLDEVLNEHVEFDLMEGK